MDVSIIYVNYKTGRLILDRLETVQRFTGGITIEIIVVAMIRGTTIWNRSGRRIRK